MLTGYILAMADVTIDLIPIAKRVDQLGDKEMTDLLNRLIDAIMSVGKIPGVG